MSGNFMVILRRASKITVFLLAMAAAHLPAGGTNTFLVLTYHDIPAIVQNDNYAVDQASFIQQLEYMKNEGYSFISVKDIRLANAQKINLPEKSILLTFDDAYKTFKDFVLPVLEAYNYPSLLAVQTGWIDSPPEDLPAPIMSWEELRAVSKSPLVEIASHTEDLHKSIVFNPHGSLGPAAAHLIYNEKTKKYETQSQYRKRLYTDLLSSKNKIKQKLNIETDILVWPYGKFSQIAIEEAKKAGYKITFNAEHLLAETEHIDSIPRIMMMKNPDLESFINGLDSIFTYPIKIRAVQADLDLVYDPDPLIQARNMDAFIERIYQIRPNTVFLQAFCDIKGDGNIESVYFPNRTLPVKADLFSFAANALEIRGIQVYAWMPMLSIVLPEGKSESLRIMEQKNNEIRPSGSWYKRLSPFSKEAQDIISSLYEDLAAHSKISGVIFQDDGYMNDFEDFSEHALETYKTITGGKLLPYQNLTSSQKIEWMRVKTNAINDLAEKCKEKVRVYNPTARFARTLYPLTLTNPESEEWFAQNYAGSIIADDYTVIMAYPYMERVSAKSRWLKKLVRKASRNPNGLEKTVFKIQTYDWRGKNRIKDKTLNRWLRILASNGALHLAYYPDNYTNNSPDMDIIRLMISTEDSPLNTERR